MLEILRKLFGKSNIKPQGVITDQTTSFNSYVPGKKKEAFTPLKLIRRAKQKVYIDDNINPAKQIKAKSIIPIYGGNPFGHQ